MSGYLTEKESQPEWDDDTYKWRLPDCGRLILETVHGTIIIDSRHDDVNAFVFCGGENAPKMGWVSDMEYACLNRKDIKLLP